jgi:hypothetical protein
LLRASSGPRPRSSCRSWWTPRAGDASNP